jgi:hypothetical protein
MDFEESRIATIDVRDPFALYSLMVTDLCGEKYFRAFEEKIRSDIQAFIAISSVDGLNYEQFNELLLLFDQDRVSRAFFDFFCSGTTCLKLDELPKAIARFRGYAMLCFGDFRFAYKKLSRLNQQDLFRALGSYSKGTDSILQAFVERPSPALKIEKIAKDKTWCLGYIAKGMYETEAGWVSAAIKKQSSNAALLKQAEFYQQLGDAIHQTEVQGLRNTDIYLTWDYMDVYVATSMRKRWEFEETAEFLTALFDTATIRKLKLRYFDPTQSQCAYRIDKGLVEALMLKRARCTVYMVQESDTMGKDSELASTLAQGKPVIAYVPRIDDVDAHARKLSQYPLEFFKLRFQVLQAEGVLDDRNLVGKLSALEADFVKIINDFLAAIAEYRESQPLALWPEMDNEFKTQSAMFGTVCKILAATEQFNFEKRAKTLREVHPLSLQVHLESGVANGVLIVRSIGECAEVLYKLLTNSLGFSIEQNAKQGCTVLKEKISQSPFRAVTNYEKLANSFWNFYLSSESKI